MRFYNHPKYCTKKEYERTIEKVVKKYLIFISSVYTFGGRYTPGISDIDFIFVIKGKKIPLNLRLFLLDEKSRYIASHPFFFIGEEGIGDFKMIYPNADIRHIAGKKINVDKITKEENKFYELITSIDIILRSFPRDYLIPLSKNKINVRNMLLRLNSLTIAFDAIERCGGRIKPNWEDFKSEVKGLRKSWFKLDKKVRKRILMRLIKGAVPISIDLTEEFNKLFKKYVSIDGKKVIYKGFQNKAVFIKDWNRERALEWARVNKFYPLLPLEFSAILVEYSKYDGLISSYIKRNLKGNIHYKIKNKNLIEKRIKILNNQASLANKLKHSHFTAFIDFGYKSNAGLVNKLFNIARKIKYRKI